MAAAALAPELLRGLGYWFFYGTDGLGAWTASRYATSSRCPSLALSYLLPVLAFAAALLTRLRHRVFFVLDHRGRPRAGRRRTPVGRAVAVRAGVPRLGAQSTWAWRSGRRPGPVPLVSWVWPCSWARAWRPCQVAAPGWHLPVAGGLIASICLNQCPLFQGQMVDRNLVRDEQVPSYWHEAAAALDAGDRDTRVYEVPGIDFAAYRWGNTVDPITPGLTDREYVARELIPYGSPPSANLLNSLEAPFQSGRPEPDALAPLARFMGVGEIVFRADTQYERYRTPRPRRTLARAARCGRPRRARAVRRCRAQRARRPAATRRRGRAGHPCRRRRPVPGDALRRRGHPADPAHRVRRRAPGHGGRRSRPRRSRRGRWPGARPTGVLLRVLREDPDGLDQLLSEPDSALVVTDTNRKQGTRWGSVRDNDGATERAGEQPLEVDLADNRLDVFPDADDDHRTVVEQRGGATVAASAYGNNVTYTPGDRAVKAFDGDESTGWKVGAFDDPTGEYLVVTTDEPVTTDRVTLLQNPGDKNRWISDVTLTFDGSEPVPVALDGSSRTSPGQTVTFPERTFDTLRITIDRTDPADAPSFRGLADVGFAEVVIPGVGPIDEVVRPPVDLLRAAGDGSIERALTYLFTRRGGNGIEPDRNPEEPTMRRWLEGPVERSFATYGRARLSRWLADDAIDALVGLPDAAEGGVTATSSERLPGDLRSRASAAVDGDPLTAYQTPINGVTGQWIEFTYAEPVSIDELVLEVVDDGSHSLPTQVTLSVDGGPGRTVELPATGSRPRAAGQTMPLVGEIEPVTGTTFRVTIDEVVEANSTDWFGYLRIQGRGAPSPATRPHPE